ncbi:MAG: HDOD domain-containing protein [Mariprofundaceae bacterium]|nr:HDOD domain-containing protein [Mariprofundaceae bacterium]
MSGQPPTTVSEQPEIPEHCLRWCFEVVAAAAPEIPPYNLCTPPAIAPAVLQGLKAAVADIPPLPEIWHKVCDMAESNEAAPRDLARLVEQDPVLTAHVLKWGNSVVYAPVGSLPPSNDVAFTLTRMGMDEAQNLILESLLPQFANIGEKSAVEAQHIWFHSKAIAMFARQLSAFSPLIDAHEAALLGLLHDIGKLIILHIESEAVLAEIAAHLQAGKSDLQAEWEVLGYTHIDAGMMLALHWQLPREVHRFIYFHHHACCYAPDEWPQDMQQTVMLIHAAHLMLQSMDATVKPGGIWAEAKRTRIDASEDILRHRLHLPLTDTALYMHLQRELERLRRLFPELYPPEAFD